MGNPSRVGTWMPQRPVSGIGTIKPCRSPMADNEHPATMGGGPLAHAGRPTPAFSSLHGCARCTLARRDYGHKDDSSCVEAKAMIADEDGTTVVTSRRTQGYFIENCRSPWHSYFAIYSGPANAIASFWAQRVRYAPPTHADWRQAFTKSQAETEQTSAPRCLPENQAGLAPAASRAIS